MLNHLEFFGYFAAGFIASLAFVLPLMAWREIRKTAAVAADVRIS